MLFFVVFEDPEASNCQYELTNGDQQTDGHQNNFDEQYEVLQKDEVSASKYANCIQ